MMVGWPGAVVGRALDRACRENRLGIEHAAVWGTERSSGWRQREAVLEKDPRAHGMGCDSLKEPGPESHQGI